MRSDLHTPTDGMPTADKYLNVSPVREVSSAPGSRSSSFKKTQETMRSKAREEEEEEEELLDARHRTNSLPAWSWSQRRHRHASDPTAPDRDMDSAARLCRVRSFKLTSKGLVNHGDSFKRRSTHSLMSSGSTTTTTDPTDPLRPRTLSVASQESSGVVSGTGSCCAPSYFRVALLGAAGVGKTAIIRQFMTSEYRGTFDIATPDAEDPETTVSVLLDGEESMIEFVDDPKDGELDSLRADAFVVVFSLADHQSFTSAVATVRYLRVDLGLDRAILLVANKADLARQRRVNIREARAMVSKYDCHLEETSAALNLHVDELLVSILTQIRQKLSPPADCHSLTVDPPASKSRSPSPRRAMSFLCKLFNQTKKKARSCDSLDIH